MTKTFLNIILWVVLNISPAILFAQDFQADIIKREGLAQAALTKGDKFKAASIYDKIGLIYWKNQQHYTAVEYFTKSLQIYKSDNKHRKQTIITYSNIGMLYSEKQNLPNALNYYQRSLDERRKSVNDTLIAAGLVDVATILRGLNRINQSNDLLTEAMKIAGRLNDLPLLRITCRNFAENYNIIGNKKKYEEYMSLYTNYDTEIKALHIKMKTEDDRVLILKLEEHTRFVESEKKAKEFEIQTQAVTSRKEKDSLQFISQANLTKKDLKRLSLDSALKATEISKAKILAEQGRLFIIALIVGLGLVLLTAFFIYRGYLITNRANKLLEIQKLEIEKNRDEIQTKSNELGVALQKITHQNTSITQSINYAQRIQSALLPNPQVLTQILPNSFILLRPRDIVSGDFFFFKYISKSVLFEDKSLMYSNTATNKLVIAAVDCTGHGIPGAFMSMIGFTLLEDIIKRGITRPNLILNELHILVRRSLRQDLTDNQDGMDIALCMLDLDNKIIEFSGAMNPLVYIQKGEVHHVKPDNKGIGGFQFDHDIKYTHFEMEVNEPTSFYIFSDGYADQFGGEKGKKFYSRKLDELLLSIHLKPFAEQREIISKTFVDWMGTKHKQIDDVLIIGFKID